MLVLPSGKSGHIEAGIAYGMGKKCYAIGEFDATDSLYNIFDNKAELLAFAALALALVSDVAAAIALPAAALALASACGTAVSRSVAL